jgi:CubicO group peptidase (beta-lactamase class C family)
MAEAQRLASDAADEIVRIADATLAAFHGAAATSVAVGVFHRGETVYGGFRGAAVLQPTRLADEGTSYRLASLSKQFTATAVLQLAGQNRLRLSAPAAELLPELPATDARIRIHHLLTHTSGLWDYEALLTPGETTQLRDRDVLDLLSGHRPRYFAPGEAFRYSNTAYALLALAVERVSGQRYADYLAENVFGPLGMSSTIAFEAGGDMVPARALGYSPTPDGPAPGDQSPTSAVLGDGGVYSSIRDLARWERALVGATLLPPPALQRMWRPARLGDGTAIPYGFGWYVDEDRGRLRLTHHGETVGFTNAVVRYPHRQLAVWLLSNATGPIPWLPAQRLADAALSLLGDSPSSAGAGPWPFHISG